MPKVAQKFESPTASMASGFTARNALNASFPSSRTMIDPLGVSGLKNDLPGTYPLRKVSGHCRGGSFSVTKNTRNEQALIDPNYLF